MMSAMAPPLFTPARALCGAFYREVVGPLLADRSHAAALLGWGSDVLGFDTERSTDHGWGPRLLVFVDDDADVPAVTERLATGLPESFQGWPVRYGWDAVPVDHHVTVTTLSGWLIEHLGVDATLGMGLIDWLVTPAQRLLGVTSGAVYADQTGELTRVRGRLEWYPDDVWRWLMACQWGRLAQEEAFVQRTAEVGDEAGSAIIASRLARDVMRLALLLERRYAPYSKWLGTAFARLDQTDGLGRHLEDAVHARDLEQREPALARAYEAVARRHNRAALTEPLDATVRPYHGRPARVLLADRYAAACLATVRDPALRALPLIGGIDQVVDSTDVLSAPQLYRRLAVLWPDLAEEAATAKHATG
jgi:Domain of unknown function (DUF4037)